MVLTILFAAIGLVIFAGIVIWAVQPALSPGGTIGISRIGAMIGGGVVAVVFVLIGFSFTQVPAGHAGVVSTFGKVELDRPLPPGLHLRLPFIQAVNLTDTRVRAFNFEGTEGATSDLQRVTLTGIVNYHVDPSEAARLFQDVGPDFEAKIFRRPAETALKAVVPLYGAADVVAKREEIGQLTEDQLAVTMEEFGIEIDGVSISNIGLSPEFLDSIERKQIAEQDTLREQQLIERQRAIADQLIETARGDAEARIERARGEATANDLLAASLTDEILEWTYVQKLADDINLMLIPSDQGLIFDLGGLESTLGSSRSALGPDPDPTE